VSRQSNSKRCNGIQIDSSGQSAKFNIKGNFYSGVKSGPVKWPSSGSLGDGQWETNFQFAWLAWVKFAIESVDVKRQVDDL